MFQGKLLRKVLEGTIHHPGKGVGWLTKEINLPFMPFAGLHLSFPVHTRFSMPSIDVSVEIELASWNARNNFFTAICVSHYLIDLLDPENAETDLSTYLSWQVDLAWDSFIDEADFSA
jgi:hypothetical protein